MQQLQLYETFIKFKNGIKLSLIENNHKQLNVIQVLLKKGFLDLEQQQKKKKKKKGIETFTDFCDVCECTPCDCDWGS